MDTSKSSDGPTATVLNARVDSKSFALWADRLSKGFKQETSTVCIASDDGRMGSHERIRKNYNLLLPFPSSLSTKIHLTPSMLSQPSPHKPSFRPMSSMC